MAVAATNNTDKNMSLFNYLSLLFWETSYQVSDKIAWLKLRFIDQPNTHVIIRYPLHAINIQSSFKI